MTSVDKIRLAKVDRLPALPGALFRLHNFFDVDVEIIAQGLMTDEESILLCLAEARTLIHANTAYGGIDRFDAEKSRLPISLLETRLRREYRRHLESTFAESGYAGAIEWPDPTTDISRDEEAAAAFVVSFLCVPLRAAGAKLRKADVATVDLWRFALPWRRILRRRLLRITDAVRCAGWAQFDVWLARRVAPGCHYPHSYTLHQRRRRPLPDEIIPLPPPQEDDRFRKSPSDAQRRFDSLPSLTQDAYVLFENYGRSVEEISRRLGIGRRNVDRRIRCALYAIMGWQLPSLASTVGFDLKLRWQRLKGQCRDILIALGD